MLGKLVDVLWAPVLVLVTHGVWAEFVRHDDALDAVMHLSGGAAVAWMSFRALWHFGDAALGTVAAPARVLFAWTSAHTIAVGWELLEFALDLTTGSQIQKSIRETMIDLVLGSLGATLVVVGLLLGGRHRQAFRRRDETG